MCLENIQQAVQTVQSFSLGVFSLRKLTCQAHPQIGVPGSHSRYSPVSLSFFGTNFFPSTVVPKLFGPIESPHFVPEWFYPWYASCIWPLKTRLSLVRWIFNSAVELGKPSLSVVRTPDTNPVGQCHSCGLHHLSRRHQKSHRSKVSGIYTFLCRMAHFCPLNHQPLDPGERALHLKVF